MVLDAVVVGGGPGGLSAANAIIAAVPKANIGVFERSRGLYPKGGVVTLNSAAVSSLKAIDKRIVKDLSTAAIEYSDFYDADKMGRPLNPNRKPLLKVKDGTGLMTQRWSFLQRSLHDNLPSSTPSVCLSSELRVLVVDTVQFGHNFVSYTEDKDIVESTFETANGEKVKVESKILIGADGYNSQVREVCLKDGPPTFSGNLIWRSYTSSRENTDRLEDGGPDIVLGRIMTESNKRLALLTSETTESFSIYVPLEEINQYGHVEPVETDSSVQDNNTETSVYEKELLLEIFKDWSPDLLEVLKRTDPERIYKRGEFIRPPDGISEQWFGKNRIAILGDAAYAIPSIGIGATLVVQKGYGIGAAIKNHGFTKEALSNFREEVFAFAKPAVLLVHEMVGSQQADIKSKDLDVKMQMEKRGLLNTYINQKQYVTL